ncbi:MAG TPA: hypothetical protein PLM34_03955, partial [Lentimicrobium sp.]|nr:hypothetical protein [Lentimicrobium sp.]
MNMNYAELKRVMLATAGSAVLLVAASGCSPQNNTKTEAMPAIDIANMDTTVNPGDNFYLYA